MMTEGSEPVTGGSSPGGTSTNASTDAGGKRAAGGGAKRRGAAAADATARTRTPDDLRTPDAAPIEEEIRLRAYELYEARGDAPGDAAEDWARAEREVRGRSSAADASLPSRDEVDESIGDM